MRIDFHNHCFPDHLAPRAVAQISSRSKGYMPWLAGTIQGLKDNLKENRLDIGVVCNISTNTRQQTAVNNFAIASNSKEIVSLGSIHPDSPTALEELERLKENGIIGVKFHSEYQDFWVDEEKMIPIYKKISELGLLVLFHMGKDLAYHMPYRCTAKRLRKMLPYLETTVIGAHWGGIGDSKEVIKYLGDTDIYLDTSFSSGAWQHKDDVLRITERFGVDRLLFGTDSPWRSTMLEIKFVESLGLTKQEQERIMGLNGIGLLRKHGYKW